MSVDDYVQQWRRKCDEMSVTKGQQSLQELDGLRIPLFAFKCYKGDGTTAVSAKFRAGLFAANRSTTQIAIPILLTTENGEHFNFTAPPCCRLVVCFAPWRLVTDEFDDGCDDCGRMSLMISGWLKPCPTDEKAKK